MLAAVIDPSLGQTLVTLAVIAGGIAALAGMFYTVPPFKQIARFFWRQLVSGPIRDWFQCELHEGVCPIIKESVAEAVPGAVAEAVTKTVKPAIAAVSEELREHMAGEESNRLELASSLAAHREYQAEQHEQTAEALGAISDRLGRVEEKIDAPMAPLEGSVVLHQVTDTAAGAL